ncbi:AAA family ATPase [Brevibacillus borstelensis]|uniref:AAA family ATPase n=1 Tax=Brevibacillus borstelensis TaxID=45462 RepID=UPI0030BE933B
MQQQNVPDRLKQIWIWREQPLGTQEATEGELLSALHVVEDLRKNAPFDRIDKAEAVVLTLLAAKRMKKPGGHTLAKEWLDRAISLDASFPLALQCRLWLYEMRLKEHRFYQGYPSVRETDNAVSRRKNLDILQEAGRVELEELGGWRILTAEATEAAKLAGEYEKAERLAALGALYAERERLLQEMLERAEEHAASLHGLFYSGESLASLQESIRSLTAQHEKRAALIDPEKEADVAEEPAGKRSALEELEALIGLQEIKERVRSLANFLRYRRLREEKGWHMQDELSLHLVFMGNPGTGKTTLARLIARLYHELGLLEREEVVEVDRSHLVGAYVGQTEQKVMEAVKRAEGGVLFIDEAYSLKRPDSSGSDYGQAAIDTLVAAMTGGEYAGRFVVMMAGYPEEMRQFLYANPGLRSRFPETGHFLLPDYNTEELLLIAEQVASRNDFTLTAETRAALRERIEQAQVDHTFGNARTVHNIVLDAIFAKGRELDAQKELDWHDFTILDREDVLPKRSDQKTDNAWEKLSALIGLEQVKAELQKISAFVDVQRKRSAIGLPALPIELHAVFTGNPGTGKTTVAGLYAERLKEIGYLKRGHLVTVSRADLVAGFVGQTAALTRRKVREALGGVLFIDEAYALAEGSETDYGHEAIHTLVEEMTRHQENLVVVLAGYPLEMQRFMASNPGLYSRFKKHIPFPDYTTDELVEMLRQKVCQEGYQVHDKTVETIRAHLERAASSNLLHGNGRLVQNLVQEAMQNQAVRITERQTGEWTRETLSMLEWEDFAPLFLPAGDGNRA